MTSTETARKDDLTAVGLDLAVIVLFAVVGRASHGEGLAVADVFHTALPFAVATLTAHLVVSWLRRSPRGLGIGAVIWVVTVAGGLAGRLLLADTVEGAFVLVGGAVMVAGMLGWRLVIAARGRARTRSRPPVP